MTLKAQQVYLIELCCFIASEPQGQEVTITGRKLLENSETNLSASTLKAPLWRFFRFVVESRRANWHHR